MNNENTVPDLSWAKVMIVDDSVTNLRSTKGLLNKYNMKVYCITSGREAVNIIKTRKIVCDAIFMDHLMPDLDGVETVKLIRALGTEYAGEVPIIALTASTADGSERLFLENGFQAFMTKPVNSVTLGQVIRKWIMKEAHAAPAPTYAAPVPPPEQGGIAGINMEFGLSLYDGDMDMFKEIIHVYAKSVPTVLERLRDVSEQSLPDYAIDIHAIRGNSANIGAQKLTERAAAMEAMAKSGDLTGVMAANEGFIQDAAALVANMEAWLSERC